MKCLVKLIFTFAPQDILTIFFSFFLQFIVLLAISQWPFCTTYGLKRPCWTMWRWKPIFTVFRRNRKIRKITKSSDTNHQYDRWGSYWNFIPLTTRVRPANYYGKLNTLPRNELLCQLLGGGLGSNEFHIKWRFGTHGSWKNQNPGGRFGATS